MKQILLLFAVLTFLSACNKNNNETPKNTDVEYFAFGSAYSECSGNCSNFFLIRDEQLFADNFDYYLYGNFADSAFQTTPYPNDKFLLAETLLTDFPDFFIVNPNETFGCPDCADQGGTHFFLKKNGIEYAWHVDHFENEQPAQIRDYMERVRAVMSEL